jgi:phosphatidylserine/phosphatidylglycerophosphate/cardiolipin synthase-like enzyme
MPSQPTQRQNKKLTGQRPSPNISRDDLLDAAGRDLVLQRHPWASNNYNSVRGSARIYADWVMEDEVPAAATHFLEYPTRRVFMEDRVQLRVQISKVALVAPEVCVYLYTPSRPGEYVQIIGSVQAQMTFLATGTLTRPARPAVHRPIQMGDVSAMTTAQAETHIGVEVQARDSFIVTAITLPAPADPEVDAIVYHATVEILDGGQRYFAHSPTIEARRWWAKPSQNVNVERMHPNRVAPLIDGENYFNEVDRLLRAAQAGDKVYLASWSFNPYTMVRGGQAATTRVLARRDRRAALVDTLAASIDAALRAGATVYLLLDSHNAEPGEEPIRHLKNFPYFHGRGANLHVRSSGHPKHISVGVGALRFRKRLGSYHEKYVCLTGSQHTALIGGIDAEPDRQNPVRHLWRHWDDDYNALLKRHVYPGNPRYVDGLFGGEEHMLWHDVGVKIEGHAAVHPLLEDFIRRWNAGEGAAATLVPQAAPAAPAGERTVQFVKTDQLVAPHNGAGPGKQLGTYDVHVQAIRSARHYVYMENQYMRDQGIAAALVAALQANAALQVILVIPFETEEAAAAGHRHYKDHTLLWLLHEPFEKIQKMQERGHIHGDFLQHRFLTSVMNAGRGRVGVYALARYVGDVSQRIPEVPELPEQIYPHAKTMIVDDTWAYIGSANANGRSMRLDGESGYVIHDRAIVTAYRQALWGEHLHPTAAPNTRAIRTFFRHWDGHCVKGSTGLLRLTKTDLANTTAVEITNPPPGQQYNGPGSWLRDLHDTV